MDQREANKIIKALNNCALSLHELARQTAEINKGLYKILNSIPKSKETEIICDGEKEDKQT